MFLRLLWYARRSRVEWENQQRKKAETETAGDGRTDRKSVAVRA